MSIKKKTLKSGIKYCFTLRYKDIYGNTKQYTSRGYNTKKEAEVEEAKYRIESHEMKLVDNKITFRYAYETYRNYKAKNLKVQSLIKKDSVYKILEPLDNIKINDFNLSMYTKFIEGLEKKQYSTEYKNRIINLLKSIIKYSNRFYNTKDYMLKYIDPFKKVNEMKKEMQFFTYEEFQKYISVIDELDYKTFFETLYYLGLRVGECTALTWKDIDFNKKEISINKTLTTKLKGQLYTVSTPKTANSYRVLPIPSRLIHSYMELKEEAMKRKYFSEEWFVFGNELPFRETTIQQRKNKYCKLAEVKQIRIHDFRHSCASFLINNGASIVLVSKYLGHSKVSLTLDTYTHLYKNELLEVSKMIDTL